MRYLPLVLLLWLMPPGPAAEEPSDIEVFSWAHTLMVAKLNDLANASFGPAVVHPQPEGRYRAVDGDVVSGALRGALPLQPSVAAVRRICDDPAVVECWRLEKLAVHGRIVFDWGEAL